MSLGTSSIASDTHTHTTHNHNSESESPPDPKELKTKRSKKKNLTQVHLGVCCASCLHTKKVIISRIVKETKVKHRKRQDTGPRSNIKLHT